LSYLLCRYCPPFTLLLGHEAVGGQQAWDGSSLVHWDSGGRWGGWFAVGGEDGCLSCSYSISNNISSHSSINANLSQTQQTPSIPIFFVSFFLLLLAFFSCRYCPPFTLLLGHEAVGGQQAWDLRSLVHWDSGDRWGGWFGLSGTYSCGSSLCPEDEFGLVSRRSRNKAVLTPVLLRSRPFPHVSTLSISSSSSLPHSFSASICGQGATRYTPTSRTPSTRD
jgi:hypothetical protein